MLYLKGCPRCRGDIEENWDQHSEYAHCLHCGKWFEDDALARLRASRQGDRGGLAGVRRVV